MKTKTTKTTKTAKTDKAVKKITLKPAIPSNPLAPQAGEPDIQTYIDAFNEAWQSAEDNIQCAAVAFRQAVEMFGWRDAHKTFSKRFGDISEYDWKLLYEIGMEKVVSGVFLLPKYMHGVRFMKLTDQWDLFNSRVVSLYKFSSEKPVTLDIGAVNASDWRVASDREKNRLRTSEEQIAYIHAKKKLFASRKPWHVSKGRAVFEGACTLTKEQLLELANSL